MYSNIIVFDDRCSVIYIRLEESENDRIQTGCARVKMSDASIKS